MARQSYIYVLHTHTHTHVYTCTHTEPERWSTCQFSGFQQNCCEYFRPDEFLFRSIKLVSVNNVQSFSNLMEALWSEYFGPILTAVHSSRGWGKVTRVAVSLQSESSVYSSLQKANYFWGLSLNFWTFHFLICLSSSQFSHFDL